METARRIREQDTNCSLLFVTTSPDFAIDSYDVNATYYLLKPVNEAQVTRALDRCNMDRINLLRRAKEQGDYLIVALSTDEFNWNEKQKKSYFSYEDRKRMLEAIRYVDLVIPEESWDQKITDVDKYHVDVFVMGDDWKGKFDFLKDKCEVVYLPRTPEISTTKIKTDLHT